LSERKSWNDFQAAVAVSALGDRDPFVARAASDAIGRHPKLTQIWPLMARYETTPEYDTHLRHSILMALRDHIAVVSGPAQIGALQLSESQRSLLAGLCLAVPSPTSAALLIQHLDTHDDNLSAYLQHAARYADANSTESLIRIARAK